MKNFRSCLIFVMSSIPILKKSLDKPSVTKLGAKFAFVFNWLNVGACGAVSALQIFKFKDYDLILAFIIDFLIFAWDLEFLNLYASFSN